MKKLLCGIALAVVAAASVPAHAVPITYTLQGVTFEDGATASGSFAYDAATQSATNFNVSTTAGILSAFVFDTTNSIFARPNGFGPNRFILFATGTNRYFSLSFASAFTDAGGTNTLNTDGSSFECLNCAPFRFVNSGAVTSAAAVPEPAALGLLGLGVLGLAAARRRKAA